MTARGVRLGVDVGRVRVGLAASDPDGMLATPVTTLNRDRKKNSDQAVIVGHIADREAVTVFVGHPVNLQGRETASTQDAVDYAEQLAGRLAAAGSAAEVRLVDERLSTVTAQRRLQQAGRRSREHRTVVDQAAAVQILQHALDMQKSLGRDPGDPVLPAGPDGEDGTDGR